MAGADTHRLGRSALGRSALGRSALGRTLRSRARRWSGPGDGTSHVPWVHAREAPATPAPRLRPGGTSRPGHTTREYEGRARPTRAAPAHALLVATAPAHGRHEQHRGGVPNLHGGAARGRSALPDSLSSGQDRGTRRAPFHPTRHRGALSHSRRPPGSGPGIRPDIRALIHVRGDAALRASAPRFLPRGTRASFRVHHLVGRESLAFGSHRTRLRARNARPAPSSSRRPTPCRAPVPRFPARGARTTSRTDVAIGGEALARGFHRARLRARNARPTLSSSRLSATCRAPVPRFLPRGAGTTFSTGLAVGGETLACGCHRARLRARNARPAPSSSHLPTACRAPAPRFPE